MHAILLVHIAAGGLALLAGYLALFAAKGQRLHRGSGTLFVCAMVVMGGSASLIAAMPGVERSVLGGVLPVYLVITGLSAVRPPTPESRRLVFWAMLVGLGLGLIFLVTATRVLAGGRFVVDGVPMPMVLFLGTVALAAGLGDLRVVRSGPRRGRSRVARHLWRMCFALWIASGSFFLGQADEIPEMLRILPLLAISAFLPLLAIPYWLWRVRGRAAGASIPAGPRPRRYRSRALAPVAARPYRSPPPARGY